MPVEHGVTADVSYDRPYYLKRRKNARRSAEVILPLVFKLTQPRSVVDVGCAAGSWLSVAKSHGAANVLGLDLGGVPRDLLEIAPEEFLACDVSKPVELDRRFDLVIALEVAEHLPEAAAPGFLDLLTRLGPVVLFSAAIPYQGGTDHFNEQWPAYWVERFLARDYLPIDCLRARVWLDDRVLAQYAQNTLLFVNRDSLRSFPNLLPLLQQQSQVSQWPPHLVHPRVYLKLVKRMTGGAAGGESDIERAMASGGIAKRRL